MGSGERSGYLAGQISKLLSREVVLLAEDVNRHLAAIGMLVRAGEQWRETAAAGPFIERTGIKTRGGKQFRYIVWRESVIPRLRQHLGLPAEPPPPPISAGVVELLAAKDARIRELERRLREYEMIEGANKLLRPEPVSEVRKELLPTLPAEGPGPRVRYFRAESLAQRFGVTTQFVHLALRRAGWQEPDSTGIWRLTPYGQTRGKEITERSRTGKSCSHPYWASNHIAEIRELVDEHRQLEQAF